MNYSKSIRKASIAKRLLISWVIIAIIFWWIGFGCGMLILSASQNPTQKIGEEARYGEDL